MILIGHDPGVVNYGFCVLEASRGKITVLASGQLLLPQYDSKKMPLFVRLYQSQLRNMHPSAKAQHYVERFQPRGFRSNLSEPVNAIIGTICISYGSVELFLPATWKNSFNKIAPLKLAYKLAHKEYKISPHRLDAFLIAWYGYHTSKGVAKPFEIFASKRGFRDYLEELARSNP